MKRIYDAVYSEKYTTKEGEEKTKYVNVGVVFQRDDGSMCAKILGSWINFYDPKPRDNQSQHNQQKQDGYQPQNDDPFNQDVPF